MYWLIGKHSSLSTQNEVLIYKQVLKPVWTYGPTIMGCTSKSNYNCLKIFQNRILRNTVNAPWYVWNKDLHRKLEVESIPEEIKNIAKRHEERPQKHINIEVLQLLNNQNLVRRLKRVEPFELV